MATWNHNPLVDSQISLFVINVRFVIVAVWEYFIFWWFAHRIIVDHTLEKLSIARTIVNPEYKRFNYLRG